jgi:hypothetical protein
VLYKWQRDGDGALAGRRAALVHGLATPDACEPAFAALVTKGTLTVADRRARFRLAVEAGNQRVAQAVGNDLPGKDRIVDREVADAWRDPLASLTRGNFTWTTAGGREVALVALERAARNDAGATRAAWVKARDKLPEADRKYGNARLGFHAARQLHPSANEWFREAGDAKLSSEAQGWRARAALRALAWDDVIAAIDAMPDTQRQETTWRYWKGRALVTRGRADEGRLLLTSIAIEPSFYGMLAAEALGQKFTAPASNPIDDQARGARGFRRSRGREARGQAGRARHAARDAARVGLHRPRPVPTRRCSSPPFTRAGSASTTARSTRPTARRRATTTPCATSHPTATSSMPPPRPTTSTSRCCTESRARSRASLTTSCRRPAPSA